MKIAIVGAGVSGLVAAYHLRPQHEVTMYEAAGHIGGHAHTVHVELGRRQYAVETGFVVYNERTYPEFTRLLNTLSIPTQPTTMGFSVRDEQSGLEYAGHSLNTLFAQRRNLIRPAFYRMLRDVLRFHRLAKSVRHNVSDAVTVQEFLTDHRFSREFVEYYLLPMGAAIWSCPTGSFAAFPIKFITEFYRNHGLLDLTNRPTWRVITGGSRNYVDSLTRDFRDRIHVNTPVHAVRRAPAGVHVSIPGAPVQRFDHIVFACHSDQALQILGSDATATEREVLSGFRYTQSDAVLHTDTRLLPKSRRAWTSWNYRLTGDPTRPATVTYNMNILQGLRSPHTFCVTLNDGNRIAPNKVIDRFAWQHPVFDVHRTWLQACHQELLNANRTSFCDAYWRNGFHEDGVVSALAVVRALDGVRRSPSPACTTWTSRDISDPTRLVEAVS